MTSEEYERRKRLLEEQLRAGIELLEAGHRQQVRALDLVWMTMAEGDAAVQVLPDEARRLAPTRAAAAPPAPPARARRAGGQLRAEVEAALERLPEVFDRNDVALALDGAPDRSSLFRVLQKLADEGRLRVEVLGGGRYPTRYRKPPAAVPTEPA